jgi:hypothetical protein
MARLLSIRIKILICLIVVSVKVSLDLVLHRTTTKETSASWLRARDDRVLIHVLGNSSAINSTETNAIPVESTLRTAKSPTEQITRRSNDSTESSFPVELVAANKTSSPLETSSATSQSTVVGNSAKTQPRVDPSFHKEEANTTNSALSAERTITNETSTPSLPSDLQLVHGKATNLTSADANLHKPDNTRNSNASIATPAMDMGNAEVPATLLAHHNAANATRLTVNSSSAFDPSKYAYAYVIGGCNPDNGHYKGFLYNIFVSARILREEGARADVVAMFQISYQSNATELPISDVRALSSLGVKIEYIPKSETESFYDTVMNKFRILALTQYRRVILMDGDVMPIGNLDYLFELSDGPNATIMENVVVMGEMEPANAGFFMLAPGDGEYDRLLDIVHQREIEAASMTTWPKFDVIKGWGHIIEPDDQWESRKGLGGTKWDFHFAFSDQGLLFHWAKYVKQRVSIIHGVGGINQAVQNWAPSSPAGKVVLKERLADPFKGWTKPRFRLYKPCRKFLCDFIHFTGKGKPWMHKPPANISATEYKRDDTNLVWWHTLYGLNGELGMGLNFTSWEPHSPPLGLIASLKDLDRKAAIRNKKKSSMSASLELSGINPRNASSVDSGARRGENITTGYNASLATLAVAQVNTTSKPSRQTANATDPHAMNASLASSSRFDPSKYAYAYVIGGCNPGNGQYKGFLYNILVSARILREEGAKADVIAMFQISYKSKAT